MNALDAAGNLIAQTRGLYSKQHPVMPALDDLEARVVQPLRVALVGSVKAGKSTLLNGLMGERIAPTDARECTRIVTWYHYGATPAVRATLASGEQVSVPARRQQERLELELQNLEPSSFQRLDVTWPAPGIEGITLIDTPGIASISQRVSHQTDQFLLPDHGAAGADAVIYLLRSLHDSDIRYMQELNDRTRHGNASIGSIAVLSRADELGSGRLSAMFTINQTLERLRTLPELQDVCETIVPVAGLMGMGATSLTQGDFTVLRALAGRALDDTEPLLVSAERFIAAKEAWLPPERVRIDLIDRYGMYGIRLGIASLRGGIKDATELASELLRRSGLEELRRVIDVHFRQRHETLKAHSIVLALHRLLRQHPVEGCEAVLIDADEHMRSAHAFTEMQLVGRLAAGNLDLDASLITELDRLIGGQGSSAHVRLGFSDPETAIDTLLDNAIEQLSRWRELCDNPLLDRATAHACAVAERSCEALVVTLMRDRQQRTEEVA